MIDLYTNEMEANPLDSTIVRAITEYKSINHQNQYQTTNIWLGSRQSQVRCAKKQYFVETKTFNTFSD